jgi:hypothetical protein
MRCASKVMNLIFSHFSFSITTPSWFSGRLWLMRLGYYKLNRPKEKADDWIWIIDHSVQIGKEKCLIILGIRSKDLPKDRALTYHDVEPIDLIPVKQSTGNVVYEQLKKASEKTGVPKEIVSDHGSDIKLGIEKFIEKNSKTHSIYDIKHKTAAILKFELENNAKWIDFIRLCSVTKSQVQQTELAFLSPPNQRSKSRYMNIEVLISWGENTIKFIDKERGSPSEEFNQNKINEKLHWLIEFREKISEWKNMMEVIETVESFVRKKGLTHDTHIKLEDELNKLNLPNNVSTANTIKEKLLDFVKQESEKIDPGDRLLGSSEIIESLFGKQKMLEGEQSKNGFTGLILSAAAFVSQTTLDVVEQAMETVRVKDIKNWITTTLCATVQSTKRKILNVANKGSKMGPNPSVILS